MKREETLEDGIGWACGNRCGRNRQQSIASGEAEVEAGMPWRGRLTMLGPSVERVQTQGQNIQGRRASSASGRAVTFADRPNDFPAHPHWSSGRAELDAKTAGPGTQAYSPGNHCACPTARNFRFVYVSDSSQYSRRKTQSKETNNEGVQRFSHSQPIYSLVVFSGCGSPNAHGASSSCYTSYNHIPTKIRINNERHRDKHPLHELVSLQTVLDPILGQNIQDRLRYLFAFGSLI
ncbi:hypothetical protein BDM02DRAFT_2007008 [Thelephora ganbajun]|uniref:Uncharacterized protein n=1 Tax=Thelephora ganbajun TaxID=370292 RepID=A0ACB6ZHP6_THEGA|nr:hypothetical protein BDM02DRAFT_2007008 [Thelephora ganbajun]